MLVHRVHKVSSATVISGKRARGHIGNKVRNTRGTWDRRTRMTQGMWDMGTQITQRAIIEHVRKENK